MQKMENFAPSDSTQKRHSIDSLCDLDAQKFLSLHKPTNLVMDKKEARNWEEFETNQEC